MGKRLILANIIVCFSFFIAEQGIAQIQENQELPVKQVIIPEKIAYINSIELLEAIPEKGKATKAINELNQKYKDELMVMQNDYNKKYSDYIADQSIMTENIKLRRMQELYELENNINEFIKIAQEDVTAQEELLIAPMKEKLQKAIEEVGNENGFTCIYDKANPAIAYITYTAIDANPLVKKKLSNMH